MIIFLEIIAVLVIAYSALGWSLYFMQRTFLYKPLREVIYTPEELGLDFENVVLKTPDDLEISGWYIPVKHADYTILFCHGNGGNMMHRLDSINIFHDLGFNCFIFDYRGYGNSQGKPTEEGTYIDARTAYDWLVKEKGISPENIIIFGRSLGGTIAAHLASKVEAMCLIIESAFTSYIDIGRKFYPYMPVKWFARFNYNTLEYVKKARCPLMVIHSRNDEIIPFEFGLELYGSSRQPNEFIEIRGSHNDGFLVSSEIYKKAWKKWIKFLKENKENSHSQQAS